MKVITLLLTALCLWFAPQAEALIVARSVAPTQAPASNEVIPAGSYFDANNYTDYVQTSGIFEAATSPAGYHGTGALVFNGTTSTATPPQNSRVDYALDFPSAGTYYIWIRLYGPASSSDSFFFGLDGTYIAPLYTDILGIWGWTSRPYTLSYVTITTPGIHTINIWGREGGSLIDGIALADYQFAVTQNDQAEIPAGFTEIFPSGGGYVAPVLAPAVVDGDNILLSWTLPTTSEGVPAGGYDSLIDGVDQNEHQTELTKTVTGLSKGVSHSFQVEARWTQADPPVFARSNVVNETIPGDPGGGGGGGEEGALLSLVGDPNFNINDLPSNIRVWYDRMWNAINNPNEYIEIDDRMNQGDIYDIGRYGNNYTTQLLLVFRATGDYALLDEVDRLYQLARAQLADWGRTDHSCGSSPKADGYLNWLWLHDPSNCDYDETDDHPMDEMLAHTGVAQLAYAFYLNKDVPGLSAERQARYTERYNFWFNYLKNHWEAKWRERNNKPTGFPFISKTLTHPTIQIARYHWYMYKMTGEEGYATEALRNINLIKADFAEVSSPYGPAWRWDHSSVESAAYPSGVQPTHYGRYTAIALADLAAAGHPALDTAWMNKLANTLGYFVMDEQAPGATSYYVNGSGTDSLSVFVISPWAVLGYWDPTAATTNRIVSMATQMHNLDEADDNNPRHMNISAGIVFSLYRDYQAALMGPLKIFPYAMGHGTNSVAGRGGTVYRVNTLDQGVVGPTAVGDGPFRCSLRAAAQATGPRTIVFEVSGVINLTSDIVIDDPYCTIAGQTAPSPGINLHHFGLRVQNTHDVLVQHLRIRVGDPNDGSNTDNRDAVQVIGATTYNVVIDHCSGSWAVDESSGTWYAVNNITFSNNLFAEALNFTSHTKSPHSMGFLFGDNGTNVSLLRNLFINTKDRNPLYKGGSAGETVNNVFYGTSAGNWTEIQDLSFSGDGRVEASIIGNAYIAGPNVNASANAIKVASSTVAGSKIYYSPTNNYENLPGSLFTGVTTHLVNSKEEAIWDDSIIIKQATEMEGWVIAHAGARPADRDAVDTRVVNNLVTRAGAIIDNQSQVGGYPTLATNSVPLALPSNPNGDDNGDGYTNLEDFLYLKALEVGQ